MQQTEIPRNLSRSYYGVTGNFITYEGETYEK